MKFEGCALKEVNEKKYLYRDDDNSVYLVDSYDSSKKNNMCFDVERTFFGFQFVIKNNIFKGYFAYSEGTQPKFTWNPFDNYFYVGAYTLMLPKVLRSKYIDMDFDEGTFAVAFTSSEFTISS